MSTSIKTVGVLGAGTMGQGIAQVCASAGYSVILYDIQPDALSRAVQAISNGLNVRVEKNKISASVSKEISGRIQTVTSLPDVKADLVIEAVVERLDIKRKLFAELESILGNNAIMTTNTSSIPVTQIAADLQSRERFAGLHFFNPASVMKLVEIVKGASTSKETIKQLQDFVHSLSKTSVITQDSPGFIVNRVARHFYVESLKIAEEQVADYKTIDLLLKATGFKMGSFELMDLIGVDVNFAVTSSMFRAFHEDAKFRPSRIQQQKVDAGHHGRKTGKGFYDYPKA